MCLCHTAHVFVCHGCFVWACLLRVLPQHRDRDSVYRVDAAATLGCPLNMPLASQNFNRWFNRHIYDRAITTSLLDKLSPAVELFQQREIDTWDGGKCTIDVDQLMRAT
eukprot:EG_transcript_36065